MIEKIISVRIHILEFFLPLFEKLSVIYEDFFFAHFLVGSNGILSQLSEMVQHLYLGWKNKGSRAPNIFNPFDFKIHAFLNHSKTDVFTHPNIRIAKNGNTPIHCIEREFMLFSKIHDPQHPLQKYCVLWLPSLVLWSPCSLVNIYSSIKDCVVC